MSLQSYREFSSYKALDRTALFLGVPLLPAVLLLVVSVAVMFVGTYFFGIVGFLFTLLLMPLALFLRGITAGDDQALAIIALELKYRAKRVAYAEFGNTLTYQPDRYLRYTKANEHQFMAIKDSVKNKQPE